MRERKREVERARAQIERAARFALYSLFSLSLCFSDARINVCCTENLECGNSKRALLTPAECSVLQRASGRGWLISSSKSCSRWARRPYLQLFTHAHKMRESVCARACVTYAACSHTHTRIVFGLLSVVINDLTWRVFSVFGAKVAP